MLDVKDSLMQSSISSSIKNAGLPVIIFGAGIVGEALFYACRNAGIKVACFCDNNVNKTKNPLCNIEVIHASGLHVKYKEAIFLISVADIKDVVEQLNLFGYLKWYACNVLLRDFDLSQCQFGVPMAFVEYAVNTCLLCHDSYLTPDKLFLRSVDIIVTERCSLKCRDCSNLMQYYKKPVDCDNKELMQTISIFCNFTDEINEFRIIGGEPFMNKEVYSVIQRLLVEPKVQRIVIYTNGTIIPGDNQITCLKNKKVLLIITNYGKLSRKISDLIKILKDNNIAFYAEQARGWTNCATIMKHNRNIEQQKKIFRNCCAKNLVTLSKGRIYRCPFAANADRLLAVPDFKDDYIDLFQEPIKSMAINEIKNRIRAFFLEKDFLNVCDYCNGRPFGDAEIQPAIQTTKPLEYTRYDVR